MILFLTLLLTLADALVYEIPVFSTKTAYGWLLMDQKYFRNPSKLQQAVKFNEQTCNAMYVNAIFRHGARYPGLKDIKAQSKLQQILDNLKTYNSITKKLQHWKNPFPESMEGQLLNLGKTENLHNGYDYFNAFDNLFIQDDKLQHLKFITSSKSRCKDSLKYFEKGIKHYLKANNIYNKKDYQHKTEHSQNDTLMRFFDKCSRYHWEVKENITAWPHYFYFFKGDHIKQVVNKVNKKFGVNRTLFNAEDVRVMYATCAFEQCFSNTSVWCSLFDSEDLSVLEYLADLKQYWIHSYGNKINYEQSCPLIQHIFDALNKTIEAHKAGKRYTVGQFMFGHAETLTPLYSSLGLFKDTHDLRTDNYIDQQKRKFRSSFILPFSANIAIVIYYCESKLSENQYKEQILPNINSGSYAIQVYINKHPVTIPDCGLVCPYEKFVAKYKQIKNCDYNKICNLNSTYKNEL